MLSTNPPMITPKIWPADWNVPLTDIIEALRPGICSRIKLKKAANAKAAKNPEIAQKVKEAEMLGINVQKTVNTPEAKKPTTVIVFLPNRLTNLPPIAAPKMPPMEEIAAKVPPTEGDIE